MHAEDLDYGADLNGRCGSLSAPAGRGKRPAQDRPDGSAGQAGGMYLPASVLLELMHIPFEYSPPTRIHIYLDRRYISRTLHIQYAFNSICCCSAVPRTKTKSLSLRRSFRVSSASTIRKSPPAQITRRYVILDVPAETHGELTGCVTDDDPAGGGSRAAPVGLLSREA